MSRVRRVARSTLLLLALACSQDPQPAPHEAVQTSGTAGAPTAEQLATIRPYLSVVLQP